MYTSGRTELLTADEVMVIPATDIDTQNIGKRGREDDNTNYDIANANTTTNINTNTNIDPKPVLKIKLPKRLLTKKVPEEVADKMEVDDNNI